MTDISETMLKYIILGRNSELVEPKFIIFPLSGRKYDTHW